MITTGRNLSHPVAPARFSHISEWTTTTLHGGRVRTCPSRYISTSRPMTLMSPRPLSWRWVQRRRGQIRRRSGTILTRLGIRSASSSPRTDERPSSQSSLGRLFLATPVTSYTTAQAAPTSDADRPVRISTGLQRFPRGRRVEDSVLRFSTGHPWFVATL